MKAADNDGDPATDAWRTTTAPAMNIGRMGGFTAGADHHAAPVPAGATAAPASTGRAVITSSQTGFGFQYVAGSNRDVTVCRIRWTSPSRTTTRPVLMVLERRLFDVIEPAAGEAGLGCRQPVTRPLPRRPGLRFINNARLRSIRAYGWTFAPGDAVRRELAQLKRILSRTANLLRGRGPGLASEIDRLYGATFDAGPWRIPGSINYRGSASAKPAFSVIIVVTQVNATTLLTDTKAVLFIGDFGTSTVNEQGIHDSVFQVQDLDTAKWNTGSTRTSSMAAPART